MSTRPHRHLFATGRADHWRRRRLRSSISRAMPGSRSASLQVIASLPRDAARRQLFLPLQFLQSHGSGIEEVFSGRQTPNVRAAIDQLIGEARRHLQTAEALLAQVPLAGFGRCSCRWPRSAAISSGCRAPTTIRLSCAYRRESRSCGRCGGPRDPGPSRWGSCEMPELPARPHLIWIAFRSRSPTSGRPPPPSRARSATRPATKAGRSARSAAAGSG